MSPLCCRVARAPPPRRRPEAASRNLGQRDCAQMRGCQMRPMLLLLLLLLTAGQGMAHSGSLSDVVAFNRKTFMLRVPDQLRGPPGNLPDSVHLTVTTPQLPASSIPTTGSLSGPPFPVLVFYNGFQVGLQCSSPLLCASQHLRCFHCAQMPTDHTKVGLVALHFTLACPCVPEPATTEPCGLVCAAGAHGGEHALRRRPVRHSPAPTICDHRR